MACVHFCVVREACHRKKPAPSRIFTRQVRAHDAVQAAVKPLNNVGLRVVCWSGCLCNLQPVAELTPDGVLELPPLITVDPNWTSKLGDPGIKYRISHCDSFLVRDSTGCTVPTETVLHGDDVLHALRCLWQWPY